jgi:hypothetical protein
MNRDFSVYASGDEIGLHIKFASDRLIPQVDSARAAVGVDG